MTKLEIYKIIVLLLLGAVAIYRWVRFFKAKKKGEEHQFTRFESLSVLILLAIFAFLTFFYKE